MYSVWPYLPISGFRQSQSTCKFTMTCPLFYVHTVAPTYSTHLVSIHSHHLFHYFHRSFPRFHTLLRTNFTNTTTCCKCLCQAVTRHSFKSCCFLNICNFFFIKNILDGRSMFDQSCPLYLYSQAFLDVLS